MKIKHLPPGFIIPAQPVMAARPPSGADWVHEIKHDGYRIIVRRDGPTVRLYSRNAYDWTARLARDRGCC
jgi:bifunctional non-homologous end joining protein LigD